MPYATTFLLTIILLFSCNAPEDISTIPLESHKEKSIDILGNRYLELDRFSGTITIAKKGDFIYNESFGMKDYNKQIPFTTSTSFKIGDITKLITLDIVEEEIQANNIKADNLLSSYDPSLNSNLTIKNALEENSNESYILLGKVLEAQKKNSFQEIIESYSNYHYLTNTFLDRENADLATGYQFHNYRGKGLELEEAPSYNLGEEWSSRGLKSNANDLLKIIKDYPEDIDIHGFLENDGFSYSLYYDSSQELAIIILSNRRHPVPKEMSNSIIAILGDKDHTLPLLRLPYSIEKKTLEPFIGTFAINENVQFDVVQSKDSLFVLMGPNQIPIIPQSENQFYMLASDAAMRFIKSETGAFDTIQLLNGFIQSEQSAVRKN